MPMANARIVRGSRDCGRVAATRPPLPASNVRNVPNVLLHTAGRLRCPLRAGSRPGRVLPACISRKMTVVPALSEPPAQQPKGNWKTRKPELIRELQLHPTVNRRVRFVIGGHSLLQKSKAIARPTRRPSATALSLVSSVSSSSRRAEPQPAQHYASRTQHPRSRRQHQWARRRQLDLPYDPSGEPPPESPPTAARDTRYRARFHRSDSDSLLTPTSPTGLRPSRMA